MDSSGTEKENTIASSFVESVPIQDSTIFSDISDLSPVKPFRGASVAQGFVELSSPPLVFTSPQINPQHQSSSPKRPQYHQISNAEISQQNDAKDADAATCIDIYGKPSTEIRDELNPSAELGDGNNSSADGKGGCPFQSADDYFADLLEVECIDTGHAAKSLVQQYDKATSSSALPEFHQDDITNDVTIAVAPSSVLEQCKEDCQVISSSYLKPVKGGEKENSDILNCFFEDHPFDDHIEHAKTENAPAVHSVEFSSISQQLEEPTKLAQVQKDGSESAVVSVEQNIVLHDSKASQQHCGMTRRSLQFDERQQHTIAKSCGSANQSNVANDFRSPATVSEVIDSSNSVICATPGSVGLENFNKPILSMFRAPKAGKSGTAITKPSGIGLHLNSIVNALPMGCGVSASVKSAEDGYLNVQGKRSFCITDANLTENAVNSLTSSKAVESLSVRSEEIQQNSYASIIATSGNLCIQSPKPVHETIPLKKSAENHSVPCDKREYKSNPKRKRKRSSAFDEGNGCKRCKCKKTKCLKLYCECFAAGIYCAETCSCQGCFNSPEYEDTVLETRQHIESRNPLAFAPKIVQRVAKPPANNIQDINKSTPSSVRHKRGCNCKKSMCLKKYCECYQSNVGCSDGCRCDGCKNVYGRREEYSSIEHIAITEATNGRSEISIDQKHDTLLHSELCTHNLTPSTPSIKYSDHGRDALSSRFPSGRYLQSPESDVALFPTNKKPPDSPKSSDTHKIVQEKGLEISDIISSEQQMYSCNSERVDNFSPNQRGTNSLGMYHNPRSMAMTSLVSPMTKVWTNDTNTQVCPESGSFSSLNSFQLCSSPVTPTVTFRENKLSKVLDCGNKCINIIEDDDTPAILKENHISVAEVKVSSPNKKRVSPPHSRFHDIGSSSSITELTSGRKFILKAVPSFPPLTPCIDVKSVTNRNTDDLDSDTNK